MIRELTIFEFEEFTNNHILSNYYQTKEYAAVAAQKGYSYEYVGYVDHSDNVLAASLILFKKIGLFNYYGYAPKGFLLDYTDSTLVSVFTKELKDYYAKRSFAFIKINPELAIGEIDLVDDFKTTYNENNGIKNVLRSNGYNKLKDNLYFESMIPRFNAIVPLKDLTINTISKNNRNKLKMGIRKGLKLVEKTRDDIELFRDILTDKGLRDANYYKDYYNTFSKNNMIDLFLVKIDYEQFLLNSRDAYEKELLVNADLNKILSNKNSNNFINQKMQSDRRLLSYKNDISEATVGLRNNLDTYVAGALVIKYKSRVHIILSGFNREYARFQPNYFLYYEIFNHYRENFVFADLNGITGDFSSSNPYDGFNRFKFGWKPKVFEFIGEFDLVINDVAYMTLNTTGALAKEFNK